VTCDQSMDVPGNLCVLDRQTRDRTSVHTVQALEQF
jgi:hypothetical protein